MKIFFSGVGGSGVSALAGFFADKGHNIYGSDRAFEQNLNHPAISPLKAKNITLVPQDGYAIDKTVDLAVFSTAVEQGHIELLKASEAKIKILTRPQFLSDLVKQYNTVAVAGTSGKSTTSGMLAYALYKLGKSPNFIGGGRVRQFKPINMLGNYLVGDSDILIIEACESDASIVNYLPQHTILLNLEFDHHSVDDTAKLFIKLMSNTAKGLFANADDKHLKDITPHNVIGFSIEQISQYQAKKLSISAFQSSFEVNGCRFHLKLPGKYNIYNALACIAFLSEMGSALQEISEILSTFEGIDRRYSIHFMTKDSFVIDDYAHNPHKITAMMQSASLASDSICYIFQPHGYAPTAMMKDEYVSAFTENLRETDHLILLPIYYAGGTVQKNISSEILADEIRFKGKSVQTIKHRNEIVQMIDKYRCYIIFGARDESLSEVAEMIAERLSKHNCIAL